MTSTGLERPVDTESHQDPPSEIDVYPSVEFSLAEHHLSHDPRSDKLKLKFGIRGPEKSGELNQFLPGEVSLRRTRTADSPPTDFSDGKGFANVQAAHTRRWPFSAIDLGVK